MTNKNYFQLGTISRLFSFRGQVILYIDADDPSIYYKLDHLLIELNGQHIPYFIEKSSIHKPNQLKIKLEGINSEADAQMILKKKVYLSTEFLPELDADQFYYHEIENFSVLNAENNSIIGTIINVIDHPGNTLLEVDVKGIEVLIPLNETTFDHIDKSNKQISIHLPEGLLDLYMEDE